jgi:hypothetical protein
MVGRMVDVDQPPAGWYLGPDQRWRWWAGDRWVSETGAPGRGTVPPSAGGGAGHGRAGDASQEPAAPARFSVKPLLFVLAVVAATILAAIWPRGGRGGDERFVPDDGTGLAWAAVDDAGWQCRQTPVSLDCRGGDGSAAAGVQPRDKAHLLRQLHDTTTLVVAYDDEAWSCTLPPDGRAISCSGR